MDRQQLIQLYQQYSREKTPANKFLDEPLESVPQWWDPYDDRMDDFLDYFMRTNQFDKFLLLIDHRCFHAEDLLKRTALHASDIRFFVVGLSGYFYSLHDVSPSVKVDTRIFGLPGMNFIRELIPENFLGNEFVVHRFYSDPNKYKYKNAAPNDESIIEKYLDDHDRRFYKLRKKMGIL